MGNWSLRTNEPADNLHIVILVQHPELGNYFTASLTAKRVASSDLEDHSWFFWLMPHKVALWIYWHVSALIDLLLFSLQHYKVYGQGPSTIRVLKQDQEMPFCLY